MKPTVSRLRQQIRRTEQARKAHVDAILQLWGAMRSGSLVTIRRKCGKPNCHCAKGEGHLTTYLSIKQEGKTRMVYVPPALRPLIAQEAQRYRRLRQHRASLAKLASLSLRVIDQLQAALQTTQPLGAVRSGAARK